MRYGKGDVVEVGGLVATVTGCDDSRYVVEVNGECHLIAASDFEANVGAIGGETVAEKMVVTVKACPVTVGNWVVRTARGEEFGRFDFRSEKLARQFVATLDR